MQTDRGKKWNEIRMRLFKMVSVGVVDDPINQGYDIVSTLMLIVNLIGAFANTFDGVRAQYASLLDLTEEITVAFFALDYALRLVTAKCLYPQLTEGRSLAKYMLSAGGIVDLLSFLPFYLPFFFPSGAAAFRLFRVARIFRLFRINAYYDSLNVITEVIVGKKQQLLSSVFIILVLMLGSSLCMYSLEHDAQPEVFKNAFSGVWWSVSTLLTIGYGDIYPITPAGKAMGIFITFLGVGMVAIPTGIISAGFVEQYTRLKRLGDYAEEEELHFIKTELHRGDLWVGKTVRELHLPQALFYEELSRQAGVEIADDEALLQMLQELAQTKKLYDKVQTALEQVKATGYGIVMPGAEELKLEKPEIVKKNGNYAVKLRASAPSIHMLRAQIETEISPMVGGEQESQQLIDYLLGEYEEDTDKLWQSNIFGKSLYELVSEGVTAKIMRMPDDARQKLTKTLGRMINENTGGMICILL